MGSSAMALLLGLLLGLLLSLLASGLLPGWAGRAGGALMEGHNNVLLALLVLAAFAFGVLVTVLLHLAN